MSERASRPASQRYYYYYYSLFLRLTGWPADWRTGELAKLTAERACEAKVRGSRRASLGACDGPLRLANGAPDNGCVPSVWHELAKQSPVACAVAARQAGRQAGRQAHSNRRKRAGGQTDGRTDGRTSGRANKQALRLERATSITQFWFAFTFLCLPSSGFVRAAHTRTHAAQRRASTINKLSFR